MIRFLDLNRLNRPYLQAFRQRLENTVVSDRLILGDALQEFERKWADYTGARHAVGTASGYDAIFLILEAFKILGKLQPGDEVIVPANTYIASILPVVRAGLKPVGVEPAGDLNIHAADVEPHITPRTKAILAVHLYGRSVDVRPLRQLAEKYGLLLLDDAAQAHGAVYENRRIGGLTDATAWSFYPTKNLGALGDGGAVTTNNERLADIIRTLRNYGQLEKYNSRYAGINSRLDTLQAAFLAEKLPDLDRLNRRRTEIAEQYHRRINHPEIHHPPLRTDGGHVYHQYVVLSPQRDRLREYLRDKGIETLIHYPVPPHKQDALKDIWRTPFPVTEKIHAQILSLPVDPYLTDDQISYIIRTINAF